MNDLFVFLDFLTWIFRVTSFAFGVLVGLMAAFGIAGGWRFYRRRVLRRNWRLDRPRHVWEGLVPEWRDYDPEIPEIAKRCVCHGRVIHPGERVLIWPEAGPGGLLHMAVYCETVKDRLWRDEHAEDVEPADGGLSRGGHRRVDEGDDAEGVRQSVAEPGGYEER